VKILVRRMGALGDVILTTPVIHRLRRENPDAEIVVHTAYPQVFNGNPHIYVAAHLVSNLGVFDRVIDLNLAYEKRPKDHIVEAYMLEAFGDRGEPCERQQELYFLKRSPLRNGTPYVVVHAARAGWSNRTLPRSTWLAVVDGIKEAGFRPIIVGTERDDLPGNHVARVMSTNLELNAELIDNAACFVGSDSGLLHVAGATRAPIVGVFTCAMPHLRLPWRDGLLGKNCMAIMPDLPCVGCLHRRPSPVTTEWCERGDNVCVDTVKAEAIVAAVVKMINYVTIGEMVI
jgi:ADP-heptose:LPS heptosyltransferase